MTAINATRRFEDKVVLITGGAGAIGSAAAKRFASEGASLVILDRDGTRAAGLAEELRLGGAAALAIAGDVGSEAEVDNAMKDAVSRFSRIDVLFNNAGI